MTTQRFTKLAPPNGERLAVAEKYGMFALIFDEQARLLDESLRSKGSPPPTTTEAAWSCPTRLDAYSEILDAAVKWMSSDERTLACLIETFDTLLDKPGLRPLVGEDECCEWDDEQAFITAEDVIGASFVRLLRLHRQDEGANLRVTLSHGIRIGEEEMLRALILGQCERATLVTGKNRFRRQSWIQFDIHILMDELQKRTTARQLANDRHAKDKEAKRFAQEEWKRRRYDKKPCGSKAHVARELSVLMQKKGYKEYMPESIVRWLYTPRKEKCQMAC